MHLVQQQSVLGLLRHCPVPWQRHLHAQPVRVGDFYIAHVLV